MQPETGETSARQMTQLELGWLAGLLEGEGYFGLIPNRVKGKTYARVGVTMTDEDVIEAVAKLLGSSVLRLKPSGNGRLPQFRTHVQGQRAVTVMRLLAPYLGLRRRAQIDAVLEFERARPDPNAARRAWSSNAATARHRDERGRLM